MTSSALGLPWCFQPRLRPPSITAMLRRRQRDFPARTFSQISASPSLLTSAREILLSSDPRVKTALSHQVRARWEHQKQSPGRKESVVDTTQLWEIGHAEAPSHPARPSRPVCLDPKELPSYKKLGVPLVTYLLHNLAHIELNAVDLCWDVIVRFRHENLPREFYGDWISIADDEARHFDMLCDRLTQLGSEYGALPAHAKLWKIAEETAHDLKARIAMIQLVAEARGLDSHRRLVDKCNGMKDKVSASLVDQICKEEVAHVTYGVKWFQWLCKRDGVDPEEQFHLIAKRHLETPLPQPFNYSARDLAGIPRGYYEPFAFKPLADMQNTTKE